MHSYSIPKKLPWKGFIDTKHFFRLKARFQGLCIVRCTHISPQGSKPQHNGVKKNLREHFYFKASVISRDFLSNFGVFVIWILHEFHLWKLGFIKNSYEPSEIISLHYAQTTIPAVVNFEYLIICVNFCLNFKRIIKKMKILNIWHLL